MKSSAKDILNRRILFPQGESLGRIHLLSRQIPFSFDGRSAKVLNAQGAVEIEGDQEIVLALSEKLGDDLRLLSDECYKLITGIAFSRLTNYARAARLQRFSHLKRLAVAFAAIDNRYIEILARNLIEELCLHNLSGSLAALTKLDIFSGLSRLSLSGLTIDDFVIKPIERLEALSQLNFQDCHLDKLPALSKSLQQLSLRNCLIEDYNSILPADERAGITYLDLAGSAIDDRFIATARERLPGLRHLDLSYTKVTEKSLAIALSLENLDYLNLAGTAVSFESTLEIAPNKTLKTLILDNTLTTDKDLERLSELNLENICLTNTCVSEQAATALRLAKAISVKHSVKEKTPESADQAPVESSLSFSFAEYMIDRILRPCISIRQAKGNWPELEHRDSFEDAFIQEGFVEHLETVKPILEQWADSLSTVAEKACIDKRSPISLEYLWALKVMIGLMALPIEPEHFEKVFDSFIENVHNRKDLASFARSLPMIPGQQSDSASLAAEFLLISKLLYVFCEKKKKSKDIEENAGELLVLSINLLVAQGLRDGLFVEAVDLYKEKLIDKDNFESLNYQYLLAVFYYRCGMTKEAEDCCGTCLRRIGAEERDSLLKHVVKVKALALLIEIDFDRKNIDRARYYCEKALEDNVIVKTLADTEGNTGEDNSALAEAMLALVFSLILTGNTQEAQELCKRAEILLRLDFNKDYFWLNHCLVLLAELERLKGDAKEAQSILAKAMPTLLATRQKQDPYLALLYLIQARIESDLGKSETSFKNYQKALAIKKKSAGAHFSTLNLLDEYSRALEKVNDSRADQVACQRKELEEKLAL